MTDLTLTVTIKDDCEPVCNIKLNTDREYDGDDLLIIAAHISRATHFMAHVSMVNSLSEAGTDDG